MITLQLKRTARNLSEDIVNTFVPEVGEPFLIESTANSSGTFISDECVSTLSSVRKDVYIKEEDWDLIAFASGLPVGVILPQAGQTVFVKFTNGNSVANPTMSIIVDTIPTTAINIAYKDGNIYNTDILNSAYNWSAGETRVFTFDGRYWLIQLPEDYMESSILFIGNGLDTVETLYNSGTYIPVSKYISADMIKNGSITIKKLDPNIDLATKDALEQIQSALEDYQDETNTSLASMDDKISIDKIYYVTCSSASSSAKTVTIPDIKVFSDRIKYDGLTLVIKFSYANTMNNPTMVVKSSIDNTTIIPECPIYVGDDPLGSVFYWKAKDSIIFSYNAQDNRWYMASTSASRIIASWCSDNDTTFINGGKIATGSITAESIAAGTITADNIAVGSLGPGVFNQEIEGIITNLSEFKRQCASAGTIVAECNSQASDSFKSASVSVDELNSVMVTNTGMPLVGTSMVVKFDHANSYQGNVYLQMQAESGSVTYNKFTAQLGFKIGNAFINIGSDGEQEFSDSQLVALDYYRWNDGEYRTVMFDGNYWIISVTTDYLAELAEWCLLNGQTWIGGGTIVTGTVLADQIQSGSIDTAKVSLVCMAPNDYGDIINYGGIGYFEGSTGDYTTKGIRMYGATDSDDPDGNPNYSIAITNRGILLQIEGGRIEGWNSLWKINGSSGVRIGDISDTSNSLYTSNIRIGNDGGTGSTTTIYGKLKITSLPTSDPHSSGQIWSNNGSLMVSNG